MDRLAEALLVVEADHPVRVAIDGVDGAGKSTLADEVASVVRGRGRPCIRASLDGFHRPRRTRYRRGRASALGYYLDSFDLTRFREELLEPLGPAGDRRYRTAVFDHPTDSAVDGPAHTAPPDALVLVDGIFLLRPELRDYWDVLIFVDVEPRLAAGRAMARDARPEDPDELEPLYRRRYLPAQRRYIDAVRPRDIADIVFRNDDPERPEVMVRAPVP